MQVNHLNGDFPPSSLVEIAKQLQALIVFGQVIWHHDFCDWAGFSAIKGKVDLCLYITELLQVLHK
jgi:hypothetical protein